METENEIITSRYKYWLGPSDEEIQKLLPSQKLLLSLLHAQVCRQCDGPGEPCPYSSCREGLRLYIHAINCIKEWECQEYMCVQTHEILSHWRQCSYRTCEICGPVKFLHKKYLEAVQPTLEVPEAEESLIRWHYPIHDQSVDFAVHESKTPQSISDLKISPIACQNTKLKELDLQRRAQMIRSMIDIMLPNMSPEIYNDILMNDVIDYASRHECTAYTEASDLEQYNSMATELAAAGRTKLQKEVLICKYDPANEVTTSLENCVINDLPKWKKWSKKEIFDQFFPILQVLYQDDEGKYFRNLVDYTSVKISDALKAKTHRIDLSLIHKKLSLGVYRDPWDVKNDFHSMFKYVWMNFNQHEQIYKACNKLSCIFNFHADTVMREMGFCCGKYYSKHQVFRCNTGNACKIGADDVYLEYLNRDKSVLSRDLYRICYQCYENAGYMAVFTDGPGKPGVPIKKKDLCGPFSNKEKKDEWEVQCLECGRRFHLICVLYKKDIWPDGYICRLCAQKLDRPPIRNQLNAENLPTNKLSDFLENKVKNLLTERNINEGIVRIRVLSSTDKLLRVKPLMRNYLRWKGMPEGPFPYRQKAVFAFQEIEGEDVCFFGFYSQEHGLNSMFQNRGHVYIESVDSISLFRPESARSLIYEAILIGYLQYAKNQGFVAVHLCINPTNDRNIEIFNGHPNDQAKPNRRSLRVWFSNMLQNARDSGIVECVDDILEDACIRGVQYITDIPYFDGDIWPEAIDFILTNARKTVKNRMPSEVKAQSRMLSSDQPTVTSYIDRNIPFDSIVKSSLFETMKDFKRDFPIIYLRPRGCIQLISDPDEPISGLLMQEREVFLRELSVRGIGFSTLREAKFATMSMLFGLHRENNNGNLYYCNNCRSVITIRWRCNTCMDYYLCPDCYQMNNHPHFMLQYGLTSQKPHFILQPVSVENYTFPNCFINVFTHASRCQIANCQFPPCSETKIVYTHYATCLQRPTGNCSICQQVDEYINLHAIQCVNPNCPVPFCKGCKLGPTVQPMIQDASSTRVKPVTCCSDQSQHYHQQPAGIGPYTDCFSWDRGTATRAEPHFKGFWGCDT